MKRTLSVVSLVLAIGTSIGCDKGKDEVSPNGTKIFGKRTLKDGTQTTKRMEFPNGEKDFNRIDLKDGTFKEERVEYPDGEKDFDVTFLPNGTQTWGRMEFPNGKKIFNETSQPDGIVKAERIEYRDGKKMFEVTWLRDGSEKAGRLELPDGSSQFDVIVEPASGVVLLDTDPTWVALQKKVWTAGEPMLREFSPEWNQIQAQIDKEVANISDPDLRAGERRRVSERLLPQQKSDELWRQAHEQLEKQQTDYLNAHKDDYRVIAYFSNEENKAYCGPFPCRYPNPVMQIKPDVEGDGVLFYKGKQGVIKDINSDTAEKWSITEEIKVQTFIRLTVREMDSVLTKFRTLEKQEIAQDAANRAPYSTLVASATGSSAMEEAGYRQATPEQVKATDAALKKGDWEQAELGVWDSDIVLAAQVDVGKDKDQKFIREGSPIYVVNKESGTIVTEVPRAAFCFAIEQHVSQGIHGDYSDENKTLRSCSHEPRE